jgi:fibronectin-binding autotransporter adhesin
MAISTATAWELRTGGNDNNGGGFVAGASGTDFSQQNAAQYTFSDLASSNGNNASPQVTSASHSFVAADVGNILQITAVGTNFILGFFQIVSVGAGAATLDRACGSAASCSGGTYAVGGGLLTPAKVAAAAVGGNVIWVQAGTFSITSALLTPSVANSAIFWNGYHISHGDNDGTKPLITTATNSIDLVDVGNSTGENFIYLNNINFSTTAVTPGLGIVAVGGHDVNLIICNSKLSGFSNAINGDNVGAHFTFQSLVLQSVEITSCTGDAVTHIGSNATQNGGLFAVYGSFIHNNTGTGYNNTAGTSPGEVYVFTDSIFDTNGGRGAVVHGSGIAINNCNFTSNTSDGLQIVSGSIQQSLNINNCVAYGNGGWGFNSSSTPNLQVFGRNNAFGNNTLGAVFQGSGGLFNLIGTVTLTANPFTSGTNFAPNATAGGGALLTGGGTVPVSPSSSPSAINIGAIQASGAAGTSGILNRAVMSGGMYG